jgi:cyclopropane-fatty-acyl-phospholipid synthase
MFQGIFESIVLKKLTKIAIGHITIHSNGSTYEFGDEDSKLQATISVLHQKFWKKVVFHGTLGFGEAYFKKDIEVDDLTDMLLIASKNRDRLGEMNILGKGISKFINSVFNSNIKNSIYNSLFNIQAHYDLGNEMFASFLDPTMMYSCPIWEDENDDDLEAAQYRKVNALLELAEIRKGMKVLEVGTGWGFLAIEAVKKYNCEVVTLTLSKEQQQLAQDRIAEAGLTDKITVLLCDYRNLDPNEFQFDRIVTCEMLEAVGPEFLPVFFKQADSLLKPNGILSLQVITMPDARYKNYESSTDFIKKHIFPGGHCPSVTSLVDSIYSGSNGRLIVDKLDNIGPHYAKALRIWRERFVANFDQVVMETGQGNIYTTEFKRKWEFYFSYCEVGFMTRTLGDIQVRLSREANQDLLAGIPF